MSRHAEVYISFGIILPLQSAASTCEDVTAAIERGRTRGEKDFGTTVLWIIDAVRHFGLEEARRSSSTKAAELHQAIIPASSASASVATRLRGPAEPLQRPLRPEAREANGLHLTAHAGENVSARKSIWSAINIGAERIGHALTAQSMTRSCIDLLAVAEKQIPLELNVTSNHPYRLLHLASTHTPSAMYFERGLMITLNSDDPPMFGATLLDEYVLVHRHFELSFDHMRELAANSVEASFLPSTRKLALLAEIEQYQP